MLMLVELPVNRVRAYFEYRSQVRIFCSFRFCKRAYLHWFVERDSVVLDSEWHWGFDCPHFDVLRFDLPVFESCRSSDRGCSMIADLVSFLEKVEIHYQVAVSLGSFFR